MTLRHINFKGELFVSVYEAAHCYGVEIVEVREWIRAELLPSPETIEGTEAIPARDLDRIALLVHYTRLLGVDLPTLRSIADLGLLGR